MRQGYRIAFVTLALACVAVPLAWKLAPDGEPEPQENRGGGFSLDPLAGQTRERPDPAVRAKEAGFASVEEMETFQAIAQRSGPRSQPKVEKLSKEQEALIRELLTRKDQRCRDMAIGMIGNMSPNLQEMWVPTVRELYKSDAENRAVKRILGSWCGSGGVPLVEDLMKDEDKVLAEAARRAAYATYSPKASTVGM